MKTRLITGLVISGCFLALLSGCSKEIAPKDESATKENDIAARCGVKTPPTATISTFATGFNDPRGLEFGKDGMLYVAEAGIGGTTSSATFGCAQTPAPFGPYFGSTTGGRISKVNRWGVRSTVTTQLPSSVSSTNDLSGPSDLVFMENKLYVLSNGGCSKGVPSRPAGIYRIENNGSATLVANLSAWSLNNPVANPDDDFQPDGEWYGLVAKGSDLYALNANHGELVRIRKNGAVSRVVDFSAIDKNYVPTAIDKQGKLFVGNLGGFPSTANCSIVSVKSDGTVKTEIGGLSMVLGLVTDDDWTYVLELTSGAPFPTPGLGRVLAVDDKGNKHVLVSGLNFPTALTMGPDGNLYVTQWGFGQPPGGGIVSRIKLD